MQLEIEELGSCRKRLKIEVPSEKVEEELDKAYEHLHRTMDVPGFRRGHIPRRLVERKFGKKLLSGAKAEQTAEAYKQAVTDNNLKVIDSEELPEPDDIEYVKGSPMRFEVVVTVEPVTDIGEYKGIEVAVEPIEVSETEVEEEIKRLVSRYSEFVDVTDRVVQKEDTIVCDVSIIVENETIYSTEGSYLYAGSEGLLGFVIPELPETLEGKGISDVVTSPVKLGEGQAVIDLDPKYLGRDATISVKITGIRAIERPRLDDEKLLRDLGVGSEAELRESIREALLKVKERQQNRDIENKIADKLVERLDVELPQEFLEKHTEKAIHQKEIELLKKGLSAEEVEQQREELQKESQENTELVYKRQLVIEHIADEENLFVTEDELESTITALAVRAGRESGEFREEVEKLGIMEQLRYDLLTGKVMKFLRENAKVIETFDSPSQEVEETEAGIDEDEGGEADETI